MRRDFMQTVQHKVAISALPGATFRGSKAGLIAAVRKFLRAIDLSDFAVTDPKRFATRLDQMTYKLTKLPRVRQLGSGSKGAELVSKRCVLQRIPAEQVQTAAS